jgi:hypothetical protein
MTVLAGDIKLMRSERLGDADDAAGRMTGTEVIDGLSNNLFADISDLDRTLGRINIAKAFVNVDTANTDTLYGVNVIIDQAPADPAVSATLFSTASWFDLRADIANFVENYLALGPDFQGYVYGNQITGQRSITLIQRTNVAPPDVGGVYVIVQDEGLSQQIMQYVRVTDVNITLTAFYDSGRGADYTRNLVTLTLADPLLHTFIGNPATQADPVNPRSVFHSTIVADAARYCGIKPLTAAASSGDFHVQADSIFNQLMPGALSETPMVNLNASGQVNPLTDSSVVDDNFTTTATIGPGLNLYLGNPCFPGSLTITGSGFSITDNAGDLYASGVIIGSIDYVSGLLTFNSSSAPYEGSKTVAFHPAAAPQRVSQTATLAVDTANRGYAWTITLQPIPRPGTLTISFRAQGKWYDLKDWGSGALSGSSPAFGAGRLDFITGAVTLTLGALPDADTLILFSYGVVADTFDRSNVEVPAPMFQYATANAPLVPGTVTITWLVGNSTKTATDNSSGVLTGDATGTVQYATGLIRLSPTLLPTAGTNFTFAYQYGNKLEEDFTAPTPNQDGTITLHLAVGDIVHKSVQMEIPLYIADFEQWTDTPSLMWCFTLNTEQNLIPTAMTTRDNGSGAFTDGITGGIDYTHGTINFTPSVTVQIPKPLYDISAVGANYNPTTDNRGNLVKGPKTIVYKNNFVGFDYVNAGASMVPTGTVKVLYRSTDSPQSVTNEVVAMSSLAFDMTYYNGENIVPGSVRFMLGGWRYIDRQGQLFCNIDWQTGSGTFAGTIDYSTGSVNLTAWNAGASRTIGVLSLLTEVGVQPIDSLFFRVPVAPVRPGSLQILATNLPGQTINATADESGLISGAGIDGWVDSLTGVASVRFGTWVTAAGHEGESWYNANAVRLDGKILQPKPVYGDTVRFNAVATTYLPLPANILGLDPVRLPVDGKVPIFRIGDVAVLHDTQHVSVNNPTAGGATNCNRVRLSRMWVKDSAGATIPASTYTVDLDAGILTWATPLDLSGFTLPALVYHRIEDMLLVSDVEIDGKLSFTRSITHDYTTASRISSALVIGDLQARWSHLFDQQTWTSVWSDAVIGSPCTANYDTLNHPITVTNDGATQERWALIFTGTTAYNCVGENVGQIASNISIVNNFSPHNPATGQPYFTIYALGFGGGWSAGNVIRFNTVAANYPVDIARTILQSNPTETSDLFSIEIRGNADR